MSDSEFKEFLALQLSRASLKKSIVEELLKDLDSWKKCFTHKTFDEKTNYETLEFYGDKIVMSGAANFIRHNFGDSVNTPVWLTRIYHHIVSSKVLAAVGMKQGFGKFLRINRDLIREDLTKKNVPNYIPIEDHKVYRSIVEDTIEAFFGQLSIALEKKISRGASVEICSRILDSYYRSAKIDISYENLFDPVTRIKELYQSKLKWIETDLDSNGRKYKTKYLVEEVGLHDGSNIYTYRVYGWLGKKNIRENDKTQISEYSHWDSDVAKVEACKLALTFLKKKGISTIPPNKK